MPSLNVFPIAVFRVSAEDAATNAPECGGGEGEGEDSIPALLMVPAAGLTQVNSGHETWHKPIDSEEGGK